MVGPLGEERARQVDELPHPAHLPALFASRQTEAREGLGADEAAGGVHDEYHLPAIVREFRGHVADGVDVVGEGFGVGSFGAGADEGDHFDGVAVLGLEDLDDFGEGGCTFPESGDEDEGGYGHCGRMVFWLLWRGGVGNGGVHR